MSMPILSGYGLVGVITNDLILPESIIQVSLHNAYSHGFVQILFINEGNIDVKVTIMGDDPPPEFVIVHYLIINPEQVVKI